jgi:glutaredoxin 3
MSIERAHVTLYTLSGCVHCARARRRLGRHGAEYIEVSGDGDPQFRRRLVELTGRATVPQVVIDGAPVGGADDLARLYRRGVLAPRLERRPFPRPVLKRRVLPWRWAVEVRDIDGRTVARRATSATRRDAERLAGDVVRPT